MNPRNDERRKFEAAAIKVKATRTNWLRQHGVPISQEFAEFADAIGELTDLAEARAEQAETPLNGPSCTVCGATMQLKVEFKCPSCGSTPAPTEPSQARVAAQWPTFDTWWARDGKFFDPDTDDVPWFDKRKELAEYAFSRARQVTAAAALVEDRPLPSDPNTKYPVLVAAALIIRDGKVLVEKRAPAGIVGLDRMFDLPGGKVEKGELPAEAVVREIREELGITVRPISLVPELRRSAWVYGKEERHWILAVYRCEIVEGEPICKDTLQWKEPKELTIENTLAVDLDIIRRFAVEDRPGPTPPYPDHECAGCNLGKELMGGKPSSIVGQGAIHLPEGWVCMKWLEPRAYAACVYRIRSADALKERVTEAGVTEGKEKP